MNSSDSQKRVQFKCNLTEPSEVYDNNSGSYNRSTVNRFLKQEVLFNSVLWWFRVNRIDLILSHHSAVGKKCRVSMLKVLSYLFKHSFFISIVLASQHYCGDAAPYLQVYVTAGQSYDLEAKLRKLEQNAKNRFGGTTDSELSELEDVVALTAARVQSAESEVVC